MPKVFLGMSGGVDSSVSAILLKEQGYDVTGVYMKNWSKDLPGMKCPWAEDLADAKRVAVQLDLDFEVWDFEEEYKKRVVDYMLAEFQRGRTPNPDVICNEEIKFKLFYEKAMARGAGYIATGHYARVGVQERCVYDEDEPSCEGIRTYEEYERVSPATTGVDDAPREESVCPRLDATLLRAKDENKDQTYFLYRMSDAATARTLFPVGNLTKPEVKALAIKHGFDVAHKKESMGVCFVGEVGMKDFLREYLDVKSGEIREIETGKTLGYHDGAIFYTIGQRHGLYLGGGLPYYVVQKDLNQNIVYVSRDLNHEKLWTDSLALEELHLRNGITVEDLTKIPDLKVRLRHRAPLVSCFVDISRNEKGGEAKPPSEQLFATNGERAKQGVPVTTGDDVASCVKSGFTSLVLTFPQPIKRPASGQSTVLYSGEVCLGGGIIV